MKRIISAVGVVTLAALAGPAFADVWNHTSRTYFGPPGNGPYGPPPPKYAHPWTAKFFGLRCCQTPEEQYKRFMEKYQIEQARHQVALSRMDWAHYEKLVNPPANPLPSIPHDCGRRCLGPTGDSYAVGDGSSRGGGCAGGNCHKAKSGCAGGGCSAGTGAAVSHSPNLMGVLSGKQGCSTCGNGGGKHAGRHAGHHANAYGMNPISEPPYTHAPYPEMNREDAIRYIEGFQYYPPYQIIRSPRDFFMFDARDQQRRN